MDFNIAGEVSVTEAIKVHYHCEGLPLITPIAAGSWIDLRAAEAVSLKAGEYRLISLGVSIALPQGYEAIIVPRSSTFKRWGILQANGIGVIDPAYRGDNDLWYFPAYATRDTDIAFGDRICQFRLLPVMGPVQFETVDRLDDPDRGGFGSTGTR